MTEPEEKDEGGSGEREQSYYVRLGCLSAKLRRRAYSRAVARIRDGKQRSLGLISELNSTVDLVGPSHHQHLVTSCFRMGKLIKNIFSLD